MASRMKGLKAKCYLNVPYAEKDEAKRLGARWDFKVKKWYASRYEPELLRRWGGFATVSQTVPKVSPTVPKVSPKASPKVSPTVPKVSPTVPKASPKVSQTVPKASQTVSKTVSQTVPLEARTYVGAATPIWIRDKLDTGEIFVLHVYGPHGIGKHEWIRHVGGLCGLKVWELVDQISWHLFHPLSNTIYGKRIFLLDIDLYDPPKVPKGSLWNGSLFLISREYMVGSKWFVFSKKVGSWMKPYELRAPDLQQFTKILYQSHSTLYQVWKGLDEKEKRSLYQGDVRQAIQQLHLGVKGGKDWYAHENNFQLMGYVGKMHRARKLYQCASAVAHFSAAEVYDGFERALLKRRAIEPALYEFKSDMDLVESVAYSTTLDHSFMFEFRDDFFLYGLQHVPSIDSYHEWTYKRHPMRDLEVIQAQVQGQKLLAFLPARSIYELFEASLIEHPEFSNTDHVPSLQVMCSDPKVFRSREAAFRVLWYNLISNYLKTFTQPLVNKKKRCRSGSSHRNSKALPSGVSED